MKTVKRILIISAAVYLTASVAFASEPSAPASTAVEEAPPAPKLDTSIGYKTRTIYEPEFFPGVRWCEQKEVDYRGEFRRVNCQDQAVIEAVSTRELTDLDAAPPSTIKDRVAPNGNILRIKFRKKVIATQPKSSEN